MLYTFCLIFYSLFFFFNDTATTEIYTLSLHDALPISRPRAPPPAIPRAARERRSAGSSCSADRKSTRLNSSHSSISYAVFCLKKKKKRKIRYKSIITKMRQITYSLQSIKQAEAHRTAE